MQITEILKYTVAGIPILILVIALIMLISKSDQSVGVRIEKGLKALRRKIPLIVGLVCLYCISFLGVMFLENRTEASTVIGLNYTEASRGLKPNKTRFNSYDIISDQVLEEVIERGGYDLTVEELRNSLSISPGKGGDEEPEDNYYVSTEYTLQYTASLPTLSLDPQEVVDLVAEVFENQFQSEYQRNMDILNIDMSEIDEADYLDKVEILDARASDVEEYMNACSQEYSSFQSKETDESFGTVAQRAANFSDVTLERLEAYILANGSSLDSAQYISKLNYENQIRNIAYMKNIAAYAVRLEAINSYERDMASVVLIPTRDENGEFYMGRTKVGVDNFADEAEKYMQSASSLQNEMETNDYAISQLMNGKDGNKEAVDQLVESAKEELNGIFEIARILLQEYDAENADDYLSVSPQDREWKDAYSLKWLVALGSMFLIAVIFFLIMIPERRKKGTVHSYRKPVDSVVGGNGA